MLSLYYPMSCVTCRRFAESKTNTTKRLPAAACHTYMYTLFINSLWPEKNNGGLNYSTFTNAPTYIQYTYSTFWGRRRRKRRLRRRRHRSEDALSAASGAASQTRPAQSLGNIWPYIHIHAMVQMSWLSNETKSTWFGRWKWQSASETRWTKATSEPRSRWTERRRDWRTHTDTHTHIHTHTQTHTHTHHTHTLTHKTHTHTHTHTQTHTHTHTHTHTNRHNDSFRVLLRSSARCG